MINRRRFAAKISAVTVFELIPWSHPFGVGCIENVEVSVMKAVC